MSRRKQAQERPRVRCAIYTRKSSEEGLDQEFNSLHAQREAAEAFIASQKAEGWEALPARYDDGGFSGGSIERPALKRLLADIEAGRIDCVVVYKVDRLSRSLLDFSRIMETFDQQGVSFVSVTQQFNTTHSMGRLTLNILLSFAQFEREIIGERIRDKVAAQKRRGKWAGGVPVLGYDVDRSGPSPRLVVNAAEASRVREIFRLYLEKGSLQPVVAELASRGWTTKRRETSAGRTVGGRRFDKPGLYHLLTNPLLAGKVVHKGEEFDGEHEAIIDPDTFQEVQTLLKSNGRGGGAEARNKYGALLRGLLRCKGCDCAMTHTFSSARAGKRYRYYRCVRAIKSGADACASGSLPALNIERLVLDEVRGLARDRKLVAEVLAESQAVVAGELTALRAERDELARELTRHHRELRRLATKGTTTGETTARIADLHERISGAERRRPELDRRIEELERQSITPAEGAHPRPEDEAATDGQAGRVPRVSMLMALAIRFQSLLDEGVVASQSELAELAHITQPRMTQIMNLLHLAPDIQEEILFLPPVVEGRDQVTERDVRGVAATVRWEEQRQRWAVTRPSHQIP